MRHLAKWKVWVKAVGNYITIYIMFMDNLLYNSQSLLLWVIRLYWWPIVSICQVCVVDNYDNCQNNHYVQYYISLSNCHDLSNTLLTWTYAWVQVLPQHVTWIPYNDWTSGTSCLRSCIHGCHNMTTRQRACNTQRVISSTSGTLLRGQVHDTHGVLLLLVMELMTHVELGFCTHADSVEILIFPHSAVTMHII